MAFIDSIDDLAHSTASSLSEALADNVTYDVTNITMLPARYNYVVTNGVGSLASVYSGSVAASVDSSKDKINTSVTMTTIISAILIVVVSIAAVLVFKKSFDDVSISYNVDY